MADKKISALTASATPLAGTEVLPIVQSGATVKVSIADVTAGRAVSASSLTASTGNFVVSTSGKGLTTGSAIPLGLGVNNTLTAITIDTASNVGIGITAPSSKLDVDGTVFFRGDTTIFAAVGGPVLSKFLNFGSASLPQAARIYSYTFSGTAGNLVLATAQSGTGVITDRLFIDSLGGVTVSNGNLIVGTAAKGIDFSANTHAAGMTSELLNDYEEGTFTATLTASTTGPTTPVTATAYYTKIGRLVTCHILFSSVDTTGASGAILITGLPFTPALIRSVGACNMGGMGAIAAVSIVSSGTTTMEIWDATQVNNILIIPGAGKTVNTTISYLV